MRLNILILIAAIIIGFIAGFLFQTAKMTPVIIQPETGMETGQPLPAFFFTSLQGTEYHSGDFAGKIMLINFWASWCAPCIIEFPHLLELASQYPDDLVLLAISSDTNAEAINRFLATKLDEKAAAAVSRDNVIIVHDGDNHLTFDIFQTARLPETIIVNRRQQMVNKLVGASWTIEEVKTLINGLDK